MDESFVSTATKKCLMVEVLLGSGMLIPLQRQKE
jgi:hypothetical protein